MAFQLEEKSKGRLLTTYHILNSAGDVVGSANIPHAEVSEFLRCWNGSAVNPQASASPATSRNSGDAYTNAFIAAMKKASHSLFKGSDLERLFLITMQVKAGITALIFTGAWLSTRHNLEVMSCGRSADDPPESLRLEMTGRFLAYEIFLNEGFVSVSAQPMDLGDPPELLLKISDSLENWRTVSKLVAAMERNQIKALFPRPLEIGGVGPDAFVIGD